MALVTSGVIEEALTMIPWSITSRPMWSAPIFLRGVSAGRFRYLILIRLRLSAYIGSLVRSLLLITVVNIEVFASGFSRIS